MLLFIDGLRKYKSVKSLINFVGYFYLAFWNHIVTNIPSYIVRYYVAKYVYGLKIGKSNIHMGVRFFSPWLIRIGDNCNIQMDCFLDGRGGLSIANNIDITPGVRILTEQHDIDDPDYALVKRNVTIEDNVIIGSYALILPGVTLAEGAVVGSGSVVAKSIESYTVAVGNPAKQVRERNPVVKYKLDYKRPFH